MLKWVGMMLGVLAAAVLYYPPGLNGVFSLLSCLKGAPVYCPWGQNILVAVVTGFIGFALGAIPDYFIKKQRTNGLGS